MVPLTLSDIVGIWEVGQDQPDWRRALLALAPAFPDLAPGRLSIGQRNAHLFALREAIIGPVMRARVQCPQCGGLLEFEQVIAELISGYEPPARHEFSFESDGYHVRFRLAASEDLSPAGPLPDARAARQALLDRTVIEARHRGEPIPAGDLPDDIIERLAERMDAADPLAQVALQLRCAFCDYIWSALLDIASYLWAELDTRARNLLADVVSLARHYGWGETEILSMTPARRGFYLDAIL